jgi:hypothetical protein
LQLVQLQHAQERFREHSIGLVGVSYDNQAILKDFSIRQGITFPLLADPQSELIQRFGVFNTTATGFTKGMAYPGFIYIGPDQQIRETFFEKQYAARYTANNVLARLFPELAESDLRTLAADHLQLQLGQSDVVVGPGSRVTLTLEITLPPSVHVYAPSVHGYKPISLTMEQIAEVNIRSPQYPESKVLYLPAIHEQAPVFEGKFRILQDVVISYSEGFRQSLQAMPKGTTRALTLKGTLFYQACDDAVCYLPEQVPVSWDLQVRPLDVTRVRKGIQHTEKP